MTVRTEEEIKEIYRRQEKTVFRVCYNYMQNVPDTEDAVQETFLRMIAAGPSFQSEEHEKAWLIRTVVNVCKNELRHWFRKHEELGEHNNGICQPDTKGEVLEAVFHLPEKERLVLYLYYYEGYSSVEIGKILHRTESAIRMRLKKGKKMLKDQLKEE